MIKLVFETEWIDGTTRNFHFKKKLYQKLYDAILKLFKLFISKLGIFYGDRCQSLFPSIFNNKNAVIRRSNPDTTYFWMFLRFNSFILVETNKNTKYRRKKTVQLIQKKLINYDSKLQIDGLQIAIALDSIIVWNKIK